MCFLRRSQRFGALYALEAASILRPSAWRAWRPNRSDWGYAQLYRDTDSGAGATPATHRLASDHVSVIPKVNVPSGECSKQSVGGSLRRLVVLSIQPFLILLLYFIQL